MINDTATNILNKNFLLNVDMLECIRRGTADILFAADNAVLLKDIPSQIYMIYTQNAKDAENLVSKIPNNIELIAAHDKFSHHLLSQKFNFSKTMICHNTVYTKNTPIKLNNSIADIKHLGVEYKDIIMKYYTKAEIVDDNYIEDRLKSNAMFGAFTENNLCGFIGSHAEGSIGMLEVLPKHRGKGIGAALQITAVNDALSHNRYPYGQVVEDNLISKSLQKKLGFELSEDKVFWLMH